MYSYFSGNESKTKIRRIFNKKDGSRSIVEEFVSSTIEELKSKPYAKWKHLFFEFNMYEPG